MSKYNILNEQNQLTSIFSEDLIDLLKKANSPTQEKNFLADKILDKLNNYLEIFLLNPQNNLSKNQFRDLLTQIIQENGFTLTAKLFQNLFDQFQLTSSTKSPNQSISLYSKPVQEKIKKIYIPFQKSTQSIETILEKISQANYLPDQFELTEKIYQLILAKKFLPHQNILKEKNAFDEMNICLEDDLNNIFDGLKQLAINFQNNITTLINFSNLRPKLSLIKSSQGLSAGPISFIKIFASTFESLRQNIPTESTPVQTIVLNIHHPDILEYLIFIKNFQKNSINKNFLFLIELTSTFLEALNQNDDFELINPATKQIINYLSSKNTFDLIISTIQENCQLGLIQENNQLYQNKISLSGHLNLAEYESQHQLNLQKLTKDLQQIENYLLNQQSKVIAQSEIPVQIKLYLTGFTDLLIKLKISQTSIQSLEISKEILQTIQKNLNTEISIGVSLLSPITNLFETSKGLEIYDNLYFSKTNVDGQETSHPLILLKNILEEKNLTNSDLINQIIQNNSLQPLYQIPADIKAIFLTSKDLSTEFHLNLQKLFETELKTTIDKRIIFENNLDLEQIKTIIIAYLQQNLRSIRFCSFEPLLPSTNNNSSHVEKNFLLNLTKIKKRKHQGLQPALFQIKKTEEISLPAIIQQKPK